MLGVDVLSSRSKRPASFAMWQVNQTMSHGNRSPHRADSTNLRYVDILTIQFETCSVPSRPRIRVGKLAPTLGLLFFDCSAGSELCHSAASGISQSLSMVLIVDSRYVG